MSAFSSGNRGANGSPLVRPLSTSAMQTLPTNLRNCRCKNLHLPSRVLNRRFLYHNPSHEQRNSINSLL
jgi:hypothetical protein